MFSASYLIFHGTYDWLNWSKLILKEVNNNLYSLLHSNTIRDTQK